MIKGAGETRGVRLFIGGCQEPLDTWQMQSYPKTRNYCCKRGRRADHDNYTPNKLRMTSKTAKCVCSHIQFGVQTGNTWWHLDLTRLPACGSAHHADTFLSSQSFVFYFSEEFWEQALVPTRLLQVNWTHRYLVGVLLSDQSDIFYSLFCRAEKQTWVNGNVQSRSSTDKTQMRSETKQIQTREQRKIALPTFFKSALLWKIQECTDEWMRLHSYKYQYITAKTTQQNNKKTSVSLSAKNSTIVASLEKYS